ncbi:MAG: HGGxSTG domain-containing protein [Sulfuricella sp.]
MSETNKRNTGSMLAAARCGAKTRSGKPCRSPKVTGKKRCRMHGGAEGSGAPKGNQNALKHGYYSREAIEYRRAMRKFIRETEGSLKDLNS